MNPEKRVKTCGENPKGNKEIWDLAKKIAAAGKEDQG